MGSVYILFTVFGLTINILHCTAYNASWWPCGPFVTPVSNLSIDKLEGQWFLLETISPIQGVHRADFCMGSTIHSSKGNLSLSMLEHYKDGDPYYKNYTVTFADLSSSAALWNIPDLWSSSVVTYVSDTAFALTSCYIGLQYDWTGLFIKPLSSVPTTATLQQIHNKLKAAGVRYVDTAQQGNLTVCNTLGYL